MKNEPMSLKITPKVSVRLSGTGGQGLLLAGRILAEAAAIHDGLNVVLSNSYGPEARGGASRSEVVMSRGEVDDIRRVTFDVLVCLSQKACDSYYGDLIENGTLIVDSTSVLVVPTSRLIEIPMTKMAVEDCGNRMVTNIISLGALCGATNVVTLDALKKAVRSTMRSELHQLNLKALQLGYDAAQNALIGAALNRRKSHIRDFSYVREGTDMRREHRKNGHSKVAAAVA